MFPAKRKWELAISVLAIGDWGLVYWWGKAGAILTLVSLFTPLPSIFPIPDP
jgi:hypothetical protein